MGELESFMMGAMSTTSTVKPRKVLVLVHVDPDIGYAPSATRQWIEGRDGISRHHHVRLFTQDRKHDLHHYKSDFARLARLITGNAVGLTLGGGGARGMSHLGVLRALEELQIPIDMIGGTSIGSFVGGLYAETPTYFGIIRRVYKFALRMGNVWTYVRDFTMPVTSWFTGAAFNFELASSFAGGQTKIENFWLNYFCVTTDLTDSSMKVHYNGTAWRYIRASMSLAGYLPPMTDLDVETGKVHFLLDGGYMNVCPADIMDDDPCCGTVIAADVANRDAFEGLILAFFFFFFKSKKFKTTKKNQTNLTIIY